MTAADPPAERQAPEGARLRVHWSVDLDGSRHILDLLPDPIHSGIALQVDGQTALRIPKPYYLHPRTEGSISIGTHSVVIALLWNQGDMATDAFVDGRSLIDGRSIEEGRTAPPPPLRGYDLWFKPVI